jgi:AbrB family looped-hinge helix DNA binding protein
MARQQTATVTSKGQVTIPVEMRRALGIADGGPVEFTLDDNVLIVRSARKPTLTELLTGFDPAKHRHSADERPWDDAPLGREHQ